MALTRPRAAQIYDIDYKQATRVVTVANITLSGGAPSQVDGVNLSLNDRVLVTGQSTLSQNGIYYVTTVGSGSNGTWSRSLDTNNTGEILSGTIVMVTEGTIYADTQWKLITDGVIDVGVTDQVWTQNYSANSITGGTSNVTVLTNANVLISSAGTANVVDIFGTGIKITGTESVTGNISGGNVLTVGLISATGNVTGNFFIGNGSLLTGIVVSAGTSLVNGTSNIVVAANGNTSIGVTGTSDVAVFATTGAYVNGLISATGNVLTGGLISATGNVTGNYILGNGALLTGVSTTSSNINNGTSNVTVVSSGGNVSVGIGGTSNIAVFATTGEYVTGLVSATGNVIASVINSTSGLMLNSNTVSANYTLPGNYNAMSAGPITVADAVNVSIGNGQRWTIV
jgi:co-chaperonin GroES (HSP10)